MEMKIIPIGNIELDLENPRIARIVSMYKKETISSEQIAMALGSGDSQEGETYATYNNLKESIRTNGGVIHPIIVNRRSKGQMIVIEGNTRVQIYREFLQDKVRGSWSKIPAIVYDKLPQKEIDAIRLQAHLVGPRPWDPYSKARYLHFLSNDKMLTIDQIIEFCGGKRKQVFDYIQAFLDMEKYYREALENEEDFDTTRFSAFVELQRNQIKTALANGGFTKKDFAEWVAQGLFHRLEAVRELPRILPDKEAKEVFLKDGTADAVLLLNQKIGPAGSETLEDANMVDLANEVSRRLAKLSLVEWKRMKSDPNDKYRLALSNLLGQLQDTLDGVIEED